MSTISERAITALVEWETAINVDPSLVRTPLARAMADLRMALDHEHIDRPAEYQTCGGCGHGAYHHTAPHGPRGGAQCRLCPCTHYEPGGH